MALLDVEHCSVTYNTGTEAVKDVSFSVGEQEIVSIVGESGSGKTTLIRTVLRLLPRDAEITEGRIWFDGNDLTALSEKEMGKYRGSEIAMIFQDTGRFLDPIQRIGKQYSEAIRSHKRISADVCNKTEFDTLSKMGLYEPQRVCSSYPFELSGGMKQRVGIAIAMTNSPRLLIADEPTSALDVTIQAQVVYQMLELRKKMNTSILMVTHNMGVASYMSDKIGVMCKGKMIEFGERDQVVFHPSSSYTQQLIDDVPKLGEVYHD